MLLKTLAGIGLFAFAGGAVGYSQVFCPDGGCAITGTPYGGAFIGGMLGLAVMSGLTQPRVTRGDEAGPAEDPADDESPSNP